MSEAWQSGTKNLGFRSGSCTTHVMAKMAGAESEGCCNFRAGVENTHFFREPGKFAGCFGFADFVSIYSVECDRGQPGATGNGRSWTKG
jgi:hypothetical protein